MVVEGNRRLTALLGLVDPGIRTQFANPSPWHPLGDQAGLTYEDQVPVVVLPDRAAATPIIGFRHISGILQWQPYAQARYVARLVDHDQMSFAAVAEMIGVDRTRVGNLYRDQAIATQARELGIETGPLEEAFSLLTVAMSTPKLRAHIDAPLGSRTEPGVSPIPAALAPELRELVTWLYGDGDVEPVIGESRDISKLRERCGLQGRPVSATFGRVAGVRDPEGQGRRCQPSAATSQPPSHGAELFIISAR